MHSRVLTLSLLLLLFHTASAATRAKGALPPPTKLHTDDAELVKAVLDHVHRPYAFNYLRTHLEMVTIYTPEQFEAAGTVAQSEFREAKKLKRLPAELTARLSEQLKKRIVHHLRTQWSSSLPPIALVEALSHAGFVEQREGKDAEEVFGPYDALVRAWFNLPEGPQESTLMGEMINTAGMGSTKISKSILEYNRCVQKVTEIKIALGPLTIKQATELEDGQAPKGVGFPRVLSYVFSRMAWVLTRMLQESWWQRLAVLILTGPEV